MYKEIKRLIKNEKLRKKLQKHGSENVKHLIKNNTVLIDKIRDSLLQNYSLNFIRNKLRIINIYNTGQKIS